ncbi:MAG: nucleotidyltransferase family protein [Gammaproteobacteria bacterium]|jgi:MurNAc alpha-1-phosphate uridylyltransferase|nr:nucleotidyltransferase family protein [Gammaproteobacteria bacterium]
MTQALLLAAGRGERMRPLTDRQPKPLLRAGGDRLIGHLLRRLATAEITEIIINTAWLGDRLQAALGSGADYGVSIRWSPEPEGALETGGGVRRAFEISGADTLLVVNADIYTDFPFATLTEKQVSSAHLVLVPNPAHHPRGDFRLAPDGRLGELEDTGTALTFSGISLLHRDLFAGIREQRFPLAPLLHQAVAAGKASGEAYHGIWRDVGTPQRLAELDRELAGA